jgi:hypothetical protein
MSVDLIQLLTELPLLIEKLEKIGFGGEADLIEHDGKSRPSLAGVIRERLDTEFNSIRGMVQGRLPFELKSQLISSGAPEPDINGNLPLAVVWNDPDLDNNGDYGWSGSAWVKSNLTSQSQISEISRKTEAVAAQPSLAGYTPAATDTIMPISVAQIGSVLRAILGYNEFGELLFDPAPETVSRISEKMGINLSGVRFGKFSVNDPDIVYAIVSDDDVPRILFSVDKNGRITSGSGSFDTLNIANIPIVYHLVNDGQSQSLGATARPPLTEPGHIDGCWMPSGGLTTMAGFSDLVPAGEGGNGNESPASGIAVGLYQWLKNTRQIVVGNKRFRFAISCPGVSGTMIEKYVPGGEHYERFFTQVEGIKNAAEKKGFQYQIHAFTWTLGGSDMNAGTTYQSYYDDLLLLRSDREQRLQQMLNRPVKLHAICWQNGARTSNSQLRALDIPNAQRYASHDVAEIHIACPYYHFQFNDSVHLTNLSSKWLGAYMQRVYREVVLLGNQWRPLEPVKITGTSDTVTADFHVPHGRLVFDRDLIAGSPLNEGFQIFDDTGELTITDVKIIAGRSVEITTAETLGANPRLQYGCVFENSGQASAGEHPRGTLRDTAGDVEQYVEYAVDSNGEPTVLPLHNFCLTFNESIEVLNAE